MKTPSAERIAEIEAMAAKRRNTFRQPEPSFRIVNRTHIGISRSCCGDCATPESRDRSDAENGTLFYKLMRLLTKNGWRVTADPHVLKHYRILTKSHRVGSKGDLAFHAEYFPAGMRIEFYPSYGGSNKNGPRYNFDHYERAAYLDKKRMDLIVGKLKARLLALEFEDVSEPIFADPRESLEYQSRASWHWKEHNIETENPPDLYSYNRGSRNGPVSNGETWYFRGYTGELLRGKVYHNINGMWWAVASGRLWNISSGDLFKYDPILCAKQYRSRNTVSRMRARLNAAIDSRNYDLATRLTDQLWRIDGGLPGEEPYVLIKGGSYYRGGSSGYTGDLGKAGLYPRKEAERHAGGEVRMVKLSELTALRAIA